MDLLDHCSRGSTLSPVYSKFILQTLYSPTSTYFYITFTHMYTYSHTHAHMYTRTHRHIYTHTDTHTHTHTIKHTYTHIQTYTIPCSQFNVHYVHKHTHKYIHAHFLCTHIANAYVHRFRFCHAQHMHTHMQVHKNTFTHTHARESSCPALQSVLKVCFVGEIRPALSNAPSSTILVFHTIIKARFVACQILRYRAS